MSEGRRFNKVLRVTPEIDAVVRAAAGRNGLTPNEAACEMLAYGGILPPEIKAQFADYLRREGKEPAEGLAYALGVGLKRLDAVERYRVSKLGGSE